MFPGTFRAAAEWGCAFIVVPWQQYQFTGDTSLMREYYAAMKRYMDYLATRTTNHIIDEGLGDWYDLGPADRPGVAQLTPPPVTATAFYFNDAQLMSQIATLLGQGGRRGQIRQVGRRKFAKRGSRKFRHADTGTYATNSQCSNALALVMGLGRAGRPRAGAGRAREGRAAIAATP